MYVIDSKMDMRTGQYTSKITAAVFIVPVT